MIYFMNDFDAWTIDGRLLRLLLAVLETGSITRAAQRLGVTQSAVSHGVQRLRVAVGDPLFVKSGRGIVPTARAEALAAPARELLAALERFARAEAFDPARWHATLTIAANDFQREALLPALLERLSAQAPGVNLRVIPSDVPDAAMLRDERAQLVLTPRPPEGSDIRQQRLFTDHYAVFYDAAVRTAPRSLADYTAAEHVTVVYEPRRTLAIDDWLAHRGVRRRLRVTVPGYAGVAAFVRGSGRLATGPSRLADTLLRGLAQVPMPLPCPPLPMYAVWHERHHDDPAHRWVRAQLQAIAAGAVPTPAPGDPGTGSPLP